MLHPEIMKQIVPGLVTSVALQYPVAYIRRIAFFVRNKMVAACFWSEEQQDAHTAFMIDERDAHSSCYIYQHGENLRESEVEISGMDEQGNAFIISVPYQRIIPARAA